MLLHLSRDTPYFPTDEWQQALVCQWLFFEQCSHEPYIAVARFIVKVAKREVEEAQRLAGLRQKGCQALTVMEGALKHSPFMIGHDFSISDITLYAYTHEAAEVGFDMDAYPEVLAWLHRVSSRPGHLSMTEACS